MAWTNLLISAGLLGANWLIQKLFEEDEELQLREDADRYKRPLQISAGPAKRVIGSARVSGQICRYATYVHWREAKRYFDSRKGEDEQQAYDRAHLVMERNCILLMAISEGPVKSISNRIWVNGRKLELVRDENVSGKWTPKTEVDGEWDSPSDPRAFPFFWAPGYVASFRGGYSKRGEVVAGNDGFPTDRPVYRPSCSFYFALPRGRSVLEPLILKARGDFNTAFWENVDEETKAQIEADALAITGNGLALCLAVFRLKRDIHGKSGPWGSIPRIEFEVVTDDTNHNPARVAKDYLLNDIGVPESDIDDEDGRALSIPEQLYPLENLVKGSEDADQVVSRTVGKDIERDSNGDLVVRDDLVTEVEYDRVLAIYNRIYPTVGASDTKQYRYHCGGVISTKDEPAQVLEGLGKAMAGRVFNYAGKWYIRPGYERHPVGTIRSYHILEEQPTIQLEPDFDTRPNSVTGAIGQDNRRDYLRTFIPEIEFDDLRERDGGRKVSRDFGTLPYVNDELLARKLMTINVNKASRGLTTVSMLCGPGEDFWIFQLKPMDVVYLDIPAEGFRVFQNAETRFVVETINPREDGSVELTVKEEPGSTYIERAGNIVARDDLQPAFGLIEDEEDDTTGPFRCTTPVWNVGVPFGVVGLDLPRVTVSGNRGDPTFTLVDNGGIDSLRIDASTGRLSIGNIGKLAESVTRTGINVNYSVQVEDSVASKSTTCTGVIHLYDVSTAQISGPSDICVNAGETKAHRFNVDYPPDVSDDYIQRHQYAFIVNRYAPQLGGDRNLPPTWVTITHEGVMTVAVPSGTASGNYRIQLQAVRRVQTTGRLAVGSDGNVETSSSPRLYAQVDLQVGDCRRCSAKTVYANPGENFSRSDVFNISGFGDTPTATLHSGHPSWLSVAVVNGEVVLTGLVPRTQATGNYAYRITIRGNSEVCTLSGIVRVAPTKPPVCNLPGNIVPGGGGRQISIDGNTDLEWTVTPTNARSGVTPAANLVSGPAWLSVFTDGSEIKMRTASGVSRPSGTYAYTINYTYAASEDSRLTRLTCTGSILVRGSTRSPLEWRIAPSSVVVNQGSGWGASTSILADTDSNCNPITYAVTTKPHSSLRVHSLSGSLVGTVPTDLDYGNYDGVFTATDKCGRTITHTITFIVEGSTGLACQADHIYGAAGSAVSGGASGSRGTTPYRYSLEHNPSWLSINSTTGRYSGRLPSTGSGNFSVVVTDARNNRQTCTGRWALERPALTCTGGHIVGETGGRPVFGTAEGEGGTGPYTFAISGNPSWLTIDSATGRYRGTLPGLVSDGSFTVTVTDSTGATATCTTTWAVIPPISPLTCQSAVSINARPGDSIRETVTATGTGVSYSLVGAPSWISISNRNPLLVLGTRITGTVPATQTTNVSFSVRATDSNSNTCTIPVTINVSAPLRFTNSRADFFVRKNYSEIHDLNLGAAGGTPYSGANPYRYAITNNTARNVRFRSGGANNGKIRILTNQLASSTMRTTTATLTVSDNGGNSVSQTLTIEDRPRNYQVENEEEVI